MEFKGNTSNPTNFTEINTTHSDSLMNEIYPLFRKIEHLRWKNALTEYLKSMEFNFEKGIIKFIYNNDSKRNTK